MIQTTKAPKWSITKQGSVQRSHDGNVVEICRVLPDGNLKFSSPENEKRFRMQVFNCLRRWKVKFNDPKAVDLPIIEETDDDGRQEEDQKSADWRDGLTPEQIRAVTFLRDGRGFSNGIPSNPPERPKLTKFHDKDPAYVEHLLKYEPGEFARIYRVERVATVNVKHVTVDRERGSQTITYTPETGVLSGRKTHLTFGPVKEDLIIE